MERKTHRLQHPGGYVIVGNTSHEGTNLQPVTVDRLTDMLLDDQLIKVITLDWPYRAGTRLWRVYLEFTHFQPGTIENDELTIVPFSWEKPDVKNFFPTTWQIIIVANYHKDKIDEACERVQMAAKPGVPVRYGSILTVADDKAIMNPRFYDLMEATVGRNIPYIFPLKGHNCYTLINLRESQWGASPVANVELQQREERLIDELQDKWLLNAIPRGIKVPDEEMERYHYLKGLKPQGD
jgi:hypothetical protein